MQTSAAVRVELHLQVPGHRGQRPAAGGAADPCHAPGAGGVVPLARAGHVLRAGHEHGEPALEEEHALRPDRVGLHTEPVRAVSGPAGGVVVTKDTLVYALPEPRVGVLRTVWVVTELQSKSKSKVIGVHETIRDDDRVTFGFVRAFLRPQTKQKVIWSYGFFRACLRCMIFLTWFSQSTAAQCVVCRLVSSSRMRL